MKRKLVLAKDAKIYFYRKINGFLFRNKNLSIKYLLNAQTYINIVGSEITLKFTDYIYFKRMWSHLNIATSLLNIGYFSDLRLKGLGSRIRKSRRMRVMKYYRFYLGHSVYKYMFKPRYLIIRNIQKFQMLIFSPFIGVSNNILTHLLLFRVIKPYKIKGVINRRKFYVSKPGKVR